MQLIGLLIINVGDDGSCFFRAVSHQLLQCEDCHGHLRQLCIEYLYLHRDRFNPFFSLDGDDIGYEEYLVYMSKLSSWAGDLEIRAMEELLGLKIIVYSTHNDDLHKPTKFNAEEMDLLKYAQPILLLHHNRNHYKSLINMNDQFPIRRP